MHAYLVTGNQNATENYISTFIKKNNFFRLDFTIKGIADSRELLNISKTKVTRPTAIVIKDIDMATVEALNALLKVIEEPQKDLIFLLTSISERSILPTIVSRCQLIKLKGDQYLFDESQVNDFIKLPIVEKLNYVSKIRKRDEAVNFCTNLTNYFHGILLKSPNNINLQNVKVCNEVLINLGKNANVLLQLSVLVLKIEDNNKLIRDDKIKGDNRI